MSHKASAVHVAGHLPGRSASTDLFPSCFAAWASWCTRAPTTRGWIATSSGATTRQTAPGRRSTCGAGALNGAASRW